MGLTRRMLLKMSSLATLALTAGVTAFIQACGGEEGDDSYGYGYGKNPYGYGYGFWRGKTRRDLDARTYEGQRVVLSGKSSDVQARHARRG